MGSKGQSYDIMYTDRCLPMNLLRKKVTQKENAMSVLGRYGKELNFHLTFGEYQYGDFVKKRLECLLNGSISMCFK